MKIKASDFNLETTLDSGQVFGFLKSPAKVYQGSIAGAELQLFQEKEYLNFKPQGKPVDPAAIEAFFDLKRDLSPLYSILEADEKLQPVCQNLKGLRLIQQDPWEGLACFILSSNNNVKRIQHIWKNLSAYYNRRRKDGSIRFPNALEIASSHENVLRELGLGYRAPFLWASAKYVAGNPRCLEFIREDDYEKACERVIAFPGIGPKVADCVLLYAFQKYEAFPVDVWILRAMQKLYFKNRKVSESRVHDFAQKRWGQNAGYVQQYIFHGIRTGII